MVNLITKINRIEETLIDTVKIFGKTISVKVIYQKIKNPELYLI